jgi:hypothetical protein
MELKSAKICDIDLRKSAGDSKTLGFLSDAEFHRGRHDLPAAAGRNTEFYGVKICEYLRY